MCIIVEEKKKKLYVQCIITVGVVLLLYTLARELKGVQFAYKLSFETNFF